MKNISDIFFIYIGPLGENRVSRPPLAKCMTTEFGCCKDNETIAQGKDFLGCPGNYFQIFWYNHNPLLVNGLQSSGGFL